MKTLYSNKMYLAILLLRYCQFFSFFANRNLIKGVKFILHFRSLRLYRGSCLFAREPPIYLRSSPVVNLVKSSKKEVGFSSHVIRDKSGTVSNFTKVTVSMEAYSKLEDRKSLANLTDHGISKLFQTRSSSNYEIFDVNL